MQQLDIRSWITILMNSSSSLNLDFISERDFLLQAAVIIDTIWFSRNLMVHQGKLQGPLEMMMDMKRRLCEHLAAWSEIEAVQQLRWQPPLPGFFKVNFDATLRGSTAFLGLVCRPPNGILLQAWGDYVLTSNPLLAEIRACISACQTAHHVNLKQVIF